MFCPMCGSELIEIPKRKLKTVDWNLPSDEIDEICLDNRQILNKKRREFLCTEQSCGFKNFPLWYHHPYNGLNSEPGDSWSLSWVK